MNGELVITLPLNTEVEAPCCKKTLTLGDITKNKGEAMLFFGIICPFCEHEGIIIRVPINLVNVKGKTN